MKRLAFALAFLPLRVFMLSAVGSLVTEFSTVITGAIKPTFLPLWCLLLLVLVVLLALRYLRSKVMLPFPLTGSYLRLSRGQDSCL